MTFIIIPNWLCYILIKHANRIEQNETEQNRIERIISIIMNPYLFLSIFLDDFERTERRIKKKHAAVRCKYQRQSEQEREKRLRNLTWE